MILVVHSVAANEHDSRGLKPLISKLEYNPEKYMQTKVPKYQTRYFTFIVEASKAVYRKKPYRTRSLSRIAILFNIINE
ncbi:MAG: hypothetical protein ACMUEL_04670 [Flavobacteriales bacterium Tduv]